MRRISGKDGWGVWKEGDSMRRMEVVLHERHVSWMLFVISAGGLVVMVQGGDGTGR